MQMKLSEVSWHMRMLRNGPNTLCCTGMTVCHFGQAHRVTLGVSIKVFFDALLWNDRGVCDCVTDPHLLADGMLLRNTTGCAFRICFFYGGSRPVDIYGSFHANMSC
jgi:hypothetical protein